ncbi:unnamed protein product, partial [Cyprideis torosa]
SVYEIRSWAEFQSARERVNQVSLKQSVSREDERKRRQPDGNETQEPVSKRNRQNVAAL